MTFLLRTLFVLIAMVALAATLAGPAQAGDPQIEAAQQQGVVGERIDGYLGIVSGNVDPALLRKVNDINNRRRALYDQLARDTGTTTEQVARITGEKQIAKAPRGVYVMGEDGVWKMN
ncbi:MAG: YdbL family protein [Henriciella sp.]|nr:YdbL family protein [Henriciella sp.]